MEKGTNIKVKSLFKFLGEFHTALIEEYLSNSLKYPYITIKSEEEAHQLFNDMIHNFISCLSEDERMTLRLYTGIDFRGINSILRGSWDYELNGKLTPESRDKYRKLCNELELIIQKFPSLKMDIKTYRGVDLRAFSDYGISTLEELVNMKGKYYYESGFTSTSVVRDSSFYSRQPAWGGINNIEIEYYIPKESKDAALLFSDTLSYSKEQNEYLINSHSLFKVMDVEIDKEKKQAFMKMVLVPKKMWNIEIKNQESRNKKVS